MAKILCPCEECIHNSKNHVCRAKNVELKWRNMDTFSEGRIDMWICKQYELSDESKHLTQPFTSLMKDMENRYK